MSDDTAQDERRIQVLRTQLQQRANQTAQTQTADYQRREAAYRDIVNHMASLVQLREELRQAIARPGLRYEFNEDPHRLNLRLDAHDGSREVTVTPDMPNLGYVVTTRPVLAGTSFPNPYRTQYVEEAKSVVIAALGFWLGELDAHEQHQARTGGLTLGKTGLPVEP